jgi:hypothetical protein
MALPKRPPSIMRSAFHAAAMIFGLSLVFAIVFVWMLNR